MRKLRWFIECRVLRKHRYSYYTGRCIVCKRTKNEIKRKER